MDNESIYNQFTSFLALSQQERDLLVKEEMKKLSIIYAHTSPSGKSYIGQTCRIGNTRWNQHKHSAKKGTKTKFATALRKYGQDVDWNHGILWVSDCEDETNQMEQYLIEKFDTVENGYNIRSGGDGGKYAEEYKDKIRERRKITSKLANIYNRDGLMIAENVSVSNFCRCNPEYVYKSLHGTAVSDWNAPTSKTNRHFYKDICALYVGEEEVDFGKRNTSGDAQLYNIFKKDGSIVESNIENLTDWCFKSGIHISSLRYTLNSDWTHPSSSNPKNIHFHKGLCVRRIEDGIPDFSNRNTSGDVNTAYYNIYNKQNILIESRLEGLAKWSKIHGYDVGSLYKTIKADRSKPSSTTNQHFHRGIRAEYV